MLPALQTVQGLLEYTERSMPGWYVRSQTERLLDRMVAQLELREQTDGWLRGKCGLGLQDWAVARRPLPAAIERLVATAILGEDELPSLLQVRKMIGQAEACAGDAAMMCLLPLDVQRALGKRKRNEHLDGMLKEAWPGADEGARRLSSKMSRDDEQLNWYANTEAPPTVQFGRCTCGGCSRRSTAWPPCTGA
jgi:hypothetical protein